MGYQLPCATTFEHEHTGKPTSHLLGCTQSRSRQHAWTRTWGNPRHALFDTIVSVAPGNGTVDKSLKPIHEQPSNQKNQTQVPAIQSQHEPSIIGHGPNNIGLSGAPRRERVAFVVDTEYTTVTSKPLHTETHEAFDKIRDYRP